MLPTLGVLGRRCAITIGNGSGDQSTVVILMLERNLEEKGHVGRYWCSRLTSADFEPGGRCYPQKSTQAPVETNYPICINTSCQSNALCSLVRLVNGILLHPKTQSGKYYPNRNSTLLLLTLSLPPVVRGICKYICLARPAPSLWFFNGTCCSCKEV